MMALEQAIRGALDVPTGRDIDFPIVSANRGTFTARVQTQGVDLAVLRVDAARRLVKHESAALRFVSESCPSLSTTVPSVIWEGSFGRRHAALQSFLSGKHQSYAKTPSQLGRQLAELSDWASGLAGGGPNSSFPTHPHLAERLSLYEGPRTFQDRVGNQQVCDTFWKAAEDIGGLHSVVSHGDLHPGNILRSEGGIRVLDWEYAFLRPSAFDWVHYISASLLDRPRPFSRARSAASALAGLFKAESRWGQEIGNATRSHMARLSLNPDASASYLKVGLFDFLWRRFDHTFESVAPLLLFDA